MAIGEQLLDTDLDEAKSRSYRNGFAMALLAGFAALSFQFWTVGDLSLETMAIFFSTAFAFVFSDWYYRSA